MTSILAPLAFLLLLPVAISWGGLGYRAKFNFYLVVACKIINRLGESVGPSKHHDDATYYARLAIQNRLFACALRYWLLALRGIPIKKRQQLGLDNTHNIKIKSRQEH